MKHWIFSGILFISVNGFAQSFTWSPDSILQSDPNSGMARYHEVLRYHDPFMYLTFPLVIPSTPRPVALQEGEGKNGYFMEGNFAYRFTMLKGKYYSFPLQQRMRLTLDVELTPRLTKDSSAPLLPMNNKFGFGLDILLSGLKDLSRQNSNMIWTTVQLHHYSNGQKDSFFIEGPVHRNNYIGGDFSTNYTRFLLNYARTTGNNIYAAALGWQHDVDLGGPFERSKDLYGYFGDDRFLLRFQVSKKPRLVTRNYVNRSMAKRDTIKVEKSRQVIYRTELEFISGRLPDFAGENKYRLGWHNYLTYMPAVSNEVGLILHTYLGRDYLNIRFDDPVFILAAGLFVKFGGK